MNRVMSRSRWLGVILLLVLTGAAVRLIFPPHVNLARELPEGNFTANELFYEFTSDPAGGYERLAGKVIILEGVVAATGEGYVLFGQEMSIVKCSFRKTIYDKKPQLIAGDRATLKGVCRGLNLTEVLVTHCILLNKSAE
jgi:hypothetical protein